jgi:TRAP-type mannitol/chloroaromatic compound transport system substrate-binding protein
VTKYWIKYPTAVGPAADALIVNMKEWEELPQDLKTILASAVANGSYRNETEAEKEIAKAWDFVEKQGIEIVEWSEEDAVKLASTAKKVIPEKYMKDESFHEIFLIVEKWATEMGYW